MTSGPDNVVVSIVMIFFNAESFIAEALSSITAQTFTSWELLLVDDGSTDGGAEIARAFIQSTHNNVEILEHTGRQRRGMSASRNLGVRHAKGRYIAFLDSDDIWFPRKLAEQLSMMSDAPFADAVIGRTLYWTNWRGSGFDASQQRILGTGISHGSMIEPPNLLLKLYPLGAGLPPSMSNLMIRREVFTRVGGFEEDFQGYYEDQVFLSKLYLSCRILISGSLWDKYRQHEGSCCALVRRNGGFDEVRLKYLIWLEKYFYSLSVQDKEVEKIIYNALSKYRQPLLYRLIRARKELRGSTVSVIRKLGAALSFTERPRHFSRRVLQTITRPLVGFVRFGSFKRLTPISTQWGADRGLPVDRFYIERFIDHHRMDIWGDVLEVKDNNYTVRYGGNRVTTSDILSNSDANPSANVIADLSNAANIADESYDCIMITQTLQFIYDIDSAVRTLFRILRPGGVVLATIPGITKIARDESECWSAQWHMSETSALRLFSKIFIGTNVEVVSHGNVLAAISFLHGLASSELTEEELLFSDRDYPIIITVRAVKEK